MAYKKCLEEGGLVKIEPSRHIAEKEIKEAKYDFEKSTESIDKEDFKWTEIKAYYCCFHALRALLFLIGLREKGHYFTFIALKEVLGKFFSKEDIEKYSNQLKRRELADYYSAYSKEEAHASIEFAEDFLFKAEKLLNSLKNKNSEELKKLRDMT